MISIVVPSWAIWGGLVVGLALYAWTANRNRRRHEAEKLRNSTHAGYIG
jgi:hypothetical protein